jgi:uncharacterized membrane protein
MISSILFSIILAVSCVTIHGLVLKFVSKREFKSNFFISTLNMTLILLASHLLHISMFALYYYELYHSVDAIKVFQGNLSGSFYDFFYYSISCYTTLGIGDIFAEGPARIVSGIESLVGLLLIAWTASFKLSRLLKIN